HHLLHHVRDHGGHGSVLIGILLHHHRPELHCNHSSDAGAGVNLVPPADLHLVALCNQPHSRSRHSRTGHNSANGRHRAHISGGYFRSGPGRRSCSVPAHVLVLFPSGGLHYGTSRHGGGQRDCSHFFP